MLKLLAHYNIRATFFVIGRYLDGDDPRGTARVLDRLGLGIERRRYVAADHCNLVLAQRTLVEGGACLRQFGQPAGHLVHPKRLVVGDRSAACIGATSQQRQAAEEAERAQEALRLG